MISERRNILFFSVTKIVYVQNSASKRSSEIVKLITHKNRTKKLYVNLWDNDVLSKTITHLPDF